MSKPRVRLVIAPIVCSFYYNSFYLFAFPVNLRDLKYFIALAETRHFGRAAAHSHVSQPTLSGQIKKLEDELGVALFERTKKTVALTPPGAALLPHARRAVEEADALVQLARAGRDPLAGPLRLGVIPTLSPYLMPLVLTPLKRRHPQMKLVLTEEVTEQLIERLRHHEVDAILIATPMDDPEFSVRPLLDEPFWLALPRRHPLYTKDTIERRDLESLDLLLLAEGHCLADQVAEVCRLAERKEAAAAADLRAASLNTLLQLVGAGMGATLVPALALRGAWTSGAGVVTRPLEWPDAFRRVRLVWRRSFPRAAAIEALATVILDHLPNTVRPVRANKGSRHKENSPSRDRTRKKA
jgi:LysR family hydrogen peroxide-inducible transcriptional activator